jgi:hypothetical protein
MQFVWSLLPGAREARNQVLIGYAWLAALALWLGVPDLPSSGKLRELVDAIGSVGVGVAVSFGAFMVGSLADDLAAPLIGTRRAKAFTSGEAGGLDLLEGMGEVGRGELERLEASIDRVSSEVGLRVGLLLPLLVAAVSFQSSGFEVWWLVGCLGVAVALGFQIARRRRDLSADLIGSEVIRVHADLRLTNRQLAQAREQADLNINSMTPGERAELDQRIAELQERQDDVATHLRRLSEVIRN